MLVIKPDECIDCGVCEPECPVDAIKADTEPGSDKWLEINKVYSELWPNISKKKIIEALWTVVFSDGSSDMYEENLMRRLSGLLYLDNKIVGNIKEEIKNRVKK